MLRTIKQLLRKLLNISPQLVCKCEYENQTFSRFNERPIEFGFVFRKLVDIYPLTVLDIGSGITALPHLIRNCGFLVTATDNIHDYWPTGMVNRHYYIVDDNITNTRLTDKFDFITCISVLEHIEKFNLAIRNMFALLNPNGHLVLSFPYNEKNYVRNVYELPDSCYGQDAPYITQSYSRNELNKWLLDNHAEIVEQEYWQFWDGDYWTVGKQVIPPMKVNVEDKHQLSCVLIRPKI